MDNNISYYLKVSEFSILMASKNVDAINCVVNHKKELHKRDICLEIFNMSKKGIIKNLDGQIEIEEGLNIILEKIAKYDKAYICMGAKENFELSCIYRCGDCFILAAVSKNDLDALRLTKMDLEETMQYIMQSFEKGEYQEEANPESIIEETEKNDTEISVDIMIEARNLQMIFSELDRKTGKLTDRIYVWRKEKDVEIHQLIEDELIYVAEEDLFDTVKNMLTV